MTNDAHADGYSDPSTYTFDVRDGNVTIADGAAGTIKVTYGSSQSLDSIPIDQAITLTSDNYTSTNTVSVETTHNATLKLYYLDIDVDSNDNACAFSISNGSGLSERTITLKLLGVTKLYSGINHAGLEKNGDKTSSGSLIIENDESINGQAQLYATSGKTTSGTISGGTGAGIGGGASYSSGDITINSGYVTGKTETGAGIGGGAGNGCGAITISGGRVEATSTTGAGIGAGHIDAGDVTCGTLASSLAGNAWINITSGDSSKNISVDNGFSGILFRNNSGEVFKNPIIDQQINVKDAQTLTIGADHTITIPSEKYLIVGPTAGGGSKLINNGTIDVTGGYFYNYYGEVTNNNKITIENTASFSNYYNSFTNSSTGSFENKGTANNHDDFTNNGSITNSGTWTNEESSGTTLSFANNSTGTITNSGSFTNNVAETGAYTNTGVFTSTGTIIFLSGSKKIELDPNGGSLNVTGLTVSSENITLTAPTKTGKTFSGWVGSKTYDATDTVTFPTSYYDTILKAQWGKVSVAFNGKTTSYHESFSEAWDEAKADTASSTYTATIKLLTNATADTDFAKTEGAISIDLNSKTLSFSQSGSSGVSRIANNGGTLYIRGNGTITGATTGSYSKSILDVSAGTVTITDSANIINTGTSSSTAVNVSSGGTFKLSSGSLTSGEEYALYCQSGGTANLTDGTLTGSGSNVIAGGGNIIIAEPYSQSTLTFVNNGTASIFAKSPDFSAVGISSIKYGNDVTGTITSNATEWSSTVNGSKYVQIAVKCLTILNASYFTFKAPDSLTYDGSSKVASVTAKNNYQTGAITVKYRSGNGPISIIAPTDEGTYQVYVDVAKGGNFKAYSNLTNSTWQFTITRASTGGSGSSGDTSATTTDTTTNEDGTVQSTTTTVPEVTSSGSGEAAVSVNRTEGKTIVENVKTAEAAAKADGKTIETNVVISDAGVIDADKISVSIPAATISALASETNATVTFKTANGDVTIDQKALDTIAAKSGDEGYVTLVVEKVAHSTLSEAVMETLGDNAKVLDLKLVTDKGNVSNFNGGVATVVTSLPDGMSPDDATCVFLDDNNVAHSIKGAPVTVNGKTMYKFVTGHYSHYAIVSKDSASKLVKKLTAPKSVKAAAVSTHSVKVTWKAATSASSYKVYKATKKSGKYRYVGKTMKTSYIVKGLKKNTNYYFKVRVVNVDGYKTSKIVTRRRMRSADRSASHSKMSAAQM